MLNSLTINNIILIDRLHIDFEVGLCVLSGETGAGKSILMDSLGLAMGGRSGRELIRHGTENASVTADFTLPEDHNIWAFLDQQDISFEAGQIILRRTLNQDGRSRAYINDQLVSISLLRDVGDMLVELHGQHDERGLLNSAGHRKLLDEYGRYGELSDRVRICHENLTSLQKQLQQEEQKLAQVKADEDYIRHNLLELEALCPEEGEEITLADERSRMMQGEQLSGGLNEVLKSLTDNNGVDATLRSTIRRMSRMAGQDKGLLDPVVEALDRAANEAGEGIASLSEILRNLEFDPSELENTEERLFALRAAARKHNCQVADLPNIQRDFEQKLRALEFGDEEVRRLTQDVVKARAAFHEGVAALSSARKSAAETLDNLVNIELPPLKMDKARFKTDFVALPVEEWNAAGGERVEFQISTNPGAPFGGLIKVASGGELSRFILALKVVLARQSTVPTLVFDEIDRGVGGAVADAVGERLKRLSGEAQVLVITHSPQVAARGAYHWLIAKAEKVAGGDVFTNIMALDRDDRREEIARMLAGATVTDEARAAATSLMQGSP